MHGNDPANMREKSPANTPDNPCSALKAEGPHELG